MDDIWIRNFKEAIPWVNLNVIIRQTLSTNLLTVIQGIHLHK